MADTKHEVAAERAKRAAAALKEAAAAFAEPPRGKLTPDMVEKFKQANHVMASAESIFGFEDIFDPPPDTVARQWELIAKALNDAAAAVETSRGRRTRKAIESLRRANLAVANTETIVAFKEAFTDPVP